MRNWAPLNRCDIDGVPNQDKSKPRCQTILAVTNTYSMFTIGLTSSHRVLFKYCNVHDEACNQLPNRSF
jgi:hypothetical protein